jgi:hypothetical protein
MRSGRQPIRWAPAAVVVAFTGGLLLTGCGSSGSPSTSSTTKPAQSAPTAPSTPVSANASPAIRYGPVVAKARFGTSLVFVAHNLGTDAPPGDLCLTGPGGTGCGPGPDWDLHGTVEVSTDATGNRTMFGYAPKGTLSVRLDGHPVPTIGRLFLASVPPGNHSVVFASSTGEQAIELGS